MPKLVDYAARFAFLREAAFAVVRDRGVGHLSRRAVAAELGLSLASVRRLLDPDAPLEQLAAAEVTARRHAAQGWSSVRPSEGDPPENVATQLAATLLPGPTHLAAEIVWLRLLLAAPHVTERAGCGEELDEADGAPLTLRERRQVADGCWSPDQPVDPPQPRDAGSTDEKTEQDQPDPLTPYVTEHREQLLVTIRSALTQLGVEGADRDHHAGTVLALVSGLVLEICLGHREVAQARSLLTRHLDDLVPRPRPVAGAGAD